MRTIYLLLFQLLVVLNVAVAAKPTTTQAPAAVATPAPATPAAADYNNTVVNRFMEYYKFGIDEKLYLQTDKPYYSAGESIWFKGYVVNAITHVPLNLSNFIYVELTDKKGELVSRVKVKRDTTYGFNGYLKLDPKMDAGDYSLRSYTKWMTANDPDFFFEKTIEIVSPIPETSMVGTAMNDAKPEQTSQEKREEKKEAKKAGKDLDYDMQFFPEGGPLIAGVAQNVAFKVIAEDGISIEVRGYIYNSKDERVAEIETVNNGMGFVQLIIPEGEQYYAKVTSSEGKSKDFKLPISSSKDVALKVTKVGANVYYQVLAANPDLLKDLSVIIHSRGRIITVDTNDMTTPRKMSLGQLYSGVSVFSLVNKAQAVISERIIFKKPTVQPKVEITPRSANYESRTKANVNLKFSTSKGTPAQGQFAVSVIDSGAILRDSTEDNALSYLLLSSELKGHIEKPGAYFLDDSRTTDIKLDLLMMTQGWRRFDLEKILDPSTNHRRSAQYEDVTNITGEVKGFFGNKARKPKLSLICQKLRIVEVFDLDSSNKFAIMDLDIPDSTVYVLQTQGRYGGNSLTLSIPEEVLPEPKMAQYPRKKEVVPFSFVNQSMEKFYYDGGLTMIQLESVVVTTEAVSKIENSEFATNSVARAEIEEMGSLTLEDYLMTYPGMQIDEETVSYRGSSVSFRVNGMEEDYVIINTLSLELIEQIDFFDATAASGLYTDVSGGVFNITLLDGASIPSLRLPNIVNYAPLGYQRVIKFYEPKYDTQSRKENLPPDYRTTIFWSGDIAPDANGNVDFTFYTADKPTNYKVIVEGVTTNGEICYGEKMIERTK